MSPRIVRCKTVRRLTTNKGYYRKLEFQNKIEHNWFCNPKIPTFVTFGRKSSSRLMIEKAKKRDHILIFFLKTEVVSSAQLIVTWRPSIEFSDQMTSQKDCV